MRPDSGVHGRPLAAVAENTPGGRKPEPRKVGTARSQLCWPGWGLDQGGCWGRRECQILDILEKVEPARLADRSEVGDRERRWGYPEGLGCKDAKTRPS